jgi:hypothetical protein
MAALKEVSSDDEIDVLSPETVVLTNLKETVDLTEDDTLTLVEPVVRVVEVMFVRTLLACAGVWPKFPMSFCGGVFVLNAPSTQRVRHAGVAIAACSLSSISLDFCELLLQERQKTYVRTNSGCCATVVIIDAVVALLCNNRCCRSITATHGLFRAAARAAT